MNFWRGGRPFYAYGLKNRMPCKTVSVWFSVSIRIRIGSTLEGPTTSRKKFPDGGFDFGGS